MWLAYLQKGLADEEKQVIQFNRKASISEETQQNKQKRYSSSEDSDDDDDDEEDVRELEGRIYTKKGVEVR